MNESVKDLNVNAVALNEEELAKVGGGVNLSPSKRLTFDRNAPCSRKSVIGDETNEGSCKRCGVYTFLDEDGYCHTCREKRSRGE